MRRRPPRSTPTDTLFPYPTLFRSHAAVRGLAYQGMRENDSNDEFPIVSPLADYNFISEPGTRRPGDQYRFDANLMALSRIEGRDSRRISVISGYQLPFCGAIGDVYELTAQVQTDGYWTHGVVPGSEDRKSTRLNSSH